MMTKGKNIKTISIAENNFTVICCVKILSPYLTQKAVKI